MLENKLSIKNIFKMMQIAMQMKDLNLDDPNLLHYIKI